MMLARYQYLRSEGFSLREAVDIVNAEEGSETVRLYDWATSGGLPGPKRSTGRTAPLVRLVAWRLVVVVGMLGGMWGYAQIA